MRTKLAAVLLAAMATYATPAFCQGTVVFANNTGLVMQRTSSVDPTLIGVQWGGGFVQLAYAPAGTRLVPWDGLSTTAEWLVANPGWSLAPTAVGLNAPVAGKFNGGAVTLNGIAAGANADFVTFGWAGTASSFDAALVTGWVGVTPLFTSATGGAGTPPTPAVNLNAVFPGIVLGIPEPGTFAVISLATAAMLMLRRRKKGISTLSGSR